METELECPICTRSFSNLITVRCEKCRVKICLACWNEIYEEHQVMLCPVCKHIERKDPISSIPSISHISIPIPFPCLNHPQHCSKYVDLLNFESLCEECEESQKPDELSHTVPIDEHLNKDLKKNIKKLILDSRPNLTPSLVSDLLIHFNTFKKNEQDEDLLKFGKQAKRLTDNRIVCPRHPLNTITYLTCNNDQIVELCDSCSPSDNTVPVDDWIRDNFYRVCSSFALCNLRPFFIEKKYRQTHVRSFSLDRDIRQNTAVWLEEIKKQLCAKIGEVVYPGICSRCPECLDLFSLERKTPVVIPCECSRKGIEHYVCLECWRDFEETKTWTCTLEGTRGNITEAPRFIKEKWIDQRVLRCTSCNKNYQILKEMKVWTLPCEHLICDNCSKNSCMCRQCKVSFSQEWLRECTSLHIIRDFYYIECDNHGVVATKVSLAELTFACSECPPLVNSSPINMSQVETKLRNAIETTFEAHQENTDVRYFLQNAQAFPLRSKVKAIREFKETGKISITEQVEMKVERFEEIFPKKITTLERAWSGLSEKPDAIRVQIHGQITLNGLILAGPLHLPSVEVTVTISSNQDQCLLNQQITLNKGRINYIQIQEIRLENSGILISVNYPGDDVYYNGAPYSRRSSLRAGKANFEILQIPAEYKYARNDLGGPILGWSVIAEKYII